jgi:Cytochrome C oxidase, cbb3-type, subunit III
MPKRIYPFVLALTALLFIISCKPEKQAWVARNIDFQTFEISANHDTTLRLKSGALLHVRKNSFLGARDKVRLKVQEIENMDNVLRSRVSTLTTDGKPLSTFYMVNIATDDQVTINPAAPLNITVPATTMASDICVYKGEAQGDEIAWTKTDTIKEQPIIDRIAQGRVLFEKNCAVCHASNLRDKLTGPPLACIEGDETVHISSGTDDPNPFASRAWLLEYTKNANAMVKSGDPRAVRLWNEYKPVVMNSFEGTLTDDQIHQIYDYIKDRSSACKLCAVMTDYYTYEEEETVIEVTERIERKEINLDRLPDDPTPNNDIVAPVISAPANLAIQRTYSFNIPEMGWYNIDRINEPIDKVENFIVITNKPSVYVNLVLPEYRIQLSLKETSPGVFHFDYAKGGKIDLPLGAKGMLIARTDENDKVPYFGGAEVFVKPDGNTYVLDLKAGNEAEFQMALAQIGNEKKLKSVKTSQRKKQFGHWHCLECPLYGDLCADGTELPLKSE